MNHKHHDSLCEEKRNINIGCKCEERATKLYKHKDLLKEKDYWREKMITARIKKEQGSLWLLIDRKTEEEYVALPVEEDELEAIVEAIKNYIGSSSRGKES